MKSRIAIFSGYGAPYYNNPRLPPARPPFGRLGRRSYYVPPERGYGPVRGPRRQRPITRAGYKVRRMKDTPAMKRAQNRMKKAAKLCSRKTKNSRGAKAFQRCMKVQLKKGKR